MINENDYPQYLNDKINALREILDDFMVNSNKSKLENEILKLSELIDDFIEKYMNSKKN